MRKKFGSVSPSAALKALRMRSNEPMSQDDREARLSALKISYDAVMTGCGAESDWLDILLCLDVCRRVMMASDADKAAVDKLALLTAEVKIAKSTGRLSELRKEAVEDAVDLFRSVVDICPSGLFDRCEVQAIRERVFAT